MEELDKYVDSVIYNVCAMAIRYDERVQMILDKLNYDTFQRDFVGRIYKNEDYIKKKNQLLNKKTYVKVNPILEYEKASDMGISDDKN
jgi:hypothetical protein